MAIKSRKRTLAGGVVTSSTEFGADSYDSMIIYMVPTAGGDLTIEGTPDGTNFYEIDSITTSGTTPALLRVTSPVPSQCRISVTATMVVYVELVREV